MADEFLTSPPWSNAAKPAPISIHALVQNEQRIGPSPRRRATARIWSNLPFYLFLVTNAVIFLRPSDWLPSLANVPIYEVMVLLTLLVWTPTMHITRAMRSPIAFCVLMLLPSVFLSHITHRDTWDARFDSMEFGKKVIYFLMIVGLITTPARLRTLLKWITPCIVGLTLLGLLQFHGIINYAALAAYQQNQIDANGYYSTFARLCSMGIFNDPNDLCMILCLGFLLCLYWLHDGQQPGPDGRRLGPGWYQSWHLRWIPVALIFLWAVYCTHSRGGFLALLTGITVFIAARFGIKRSIPLAMIVLPILLFAFAGRSTEIDTQETTAQDRIKLWSAGLEMFKSAPLFGVGMNQFVEQEKLVAHNSFVHCYAELGFLGGTLFMGGFIYSIWALARLPRHEPCFTDVATARFQPYLLGAFASYVVGYMTLSRAYTEPTYLMWGMAAAYLSIAAAHRPEAMPRLSMRMVAWAVTFGVIFVLIMYLFVRFFAHFGS